MCARNWPEIGIMRQIQYPSTAAHYLNERYFNLSDSNIPFQHLIVVITHFQVVRRRNFVIYVKMEH